MDKVVVGSELSMEALDYIVERLSSLEEFEFKELNNIKREAVRKFNLESYPSNIDIINYIQKYRPDRSSLIEYLRRKPVRTLSGVAIVAIMTRPFECPHGRCIYCPHFPGSPISYTGREPSAMRGIRNNFDPYMQVRSRISQLEQMGHDVSKIEIIIQGGTFNKTPLAYREWYMRRLLQAFIGFFPGDYVKGLVAAETSKYRIVGITFETRPDACSKEDVDWMLERGGTRVELGVQTVYDDVYRYISRGHDVKAVIDATLRLKDAGFKVTYHLMPGLPKVDMKLDLQAFHQVMNSPNFFPDNLKIYPTLVLEHTGLIRLWREGLYKPYSTDDARDLVGICKSNFVNRWNRIMRVNRDIPSHEVVDGVKMTNLRQVIMDDFKRLGLRCKCIRCREVGIKWLKEAYEGGEPRILVRRFHVNKGIEYFISVEDTENDVIYGFIRLRRPSIYAWRPEIVSAETYIVRELHVYGRSIPIGANPSRGSWQHIGLGSILLRTAEDIAVSEGGDKMVVISGVGVREYYYRFGYVRDGVYVSKRLG